jgi:hypothetical protein
MDDQKIAEARRLLERISLELKSASEAAHDAAQAAEDSKTAWTKVQLLYTRFDEAAQLLKEMRRTVDAAMS